MFNRFGKIIHTLKPYRFNVSHGRYHEIRTDHELRQDEQIKLGQMLASFPHASIQKWPTNFLNLDLTKTPKKLLFLAANAYDSFGNTVLGVAAEYGKEIKAIEKLLAIGAEIDKVDQNNKTALHWAICNKLSFYNRESFEAVAAVKCLLKYGASVEITCYQNKTPLEYAIDRGYPAAASLIKDHIQRNSKFIREMK